MTQTYSSFFYLAEAKVNNLIKLQAMFSNYRNSHKASFTADRSTAM